MSTVPGGLSLQDRVARLEATINSQDDTSSIAGAAIVQTQGQFAITAAKVQNLTLAAPVAGLPVNGGQDGQILRIVSNSAYAHTITTPANVINGNKHIATFGAAVGNNIELMAKAGQWIVLSSTGITLS